MQKETLVTTLSELIGQIEDTELLRCIYLLTVKLLPRSKQSAESEVCR